MIGRFAMSIKTTQVTNVVNIGWGWGLALICFQEKKGGTFSNYGNSVGRSGHVEWSVYRASILGNNIGLQVTEEVFLSVNKHVCVCGGVTECLPQWPVKWETFG